MQNLLGQYLIAGFPAECCKVQGAEEFGYALLYHSRVKTSL